MIEKKCENCKKEASFVQIAPIETQSSVKIYDIAGGTRVEVKAYSTNLENAVKDATKWYDKLKEQYKTEE